MGFAGDFFPSVWGPQRVSVEQLRAEAKFETCQPHNLGLTVVLEYKGKRISEVVKRPPDSRPEFASILCNAISPYKGQPFWLIEHIVINS